MTEAAIASHRELVRSADQWEAEIEAIAAQGSYLEKLEGIDALRHSGEIWGRAVAMLASHTEDEVYATEKPAVAASVLALRDHIARMHTIAVDGAQLLEEHL